MSSNLFSLTLLNGPTFSNTKPSNFLFNGVDEYASITSSSIKNYTTITATLWMNIVSYISTFETYFAYNSEEASLTQGWRVRRRGGHRR